MKQEKSFFKTRKIINDDNNCVQMKIHDKPQVYVLNLILFYCFSGKLSLFSRRYLYLKGFSYRVHFYVTLILTNQ